jgi:hypothetical protein
MKKRRAASNQRVSELGPALAAVATQVMPTIAAKLKSTRSRSVRARLSCGVVSFDMVVLNASRWAFRA